MHIGTCVNLVRFLSHYFRFLKILVPHSLLSLTGSKVLIGVGNKGGSGMGWVTLANNNSEVSIPLNTFEVVAASNSRLLKSLTIEAINP